jgi:predicted acylesterase/phospholipase RssA
MSDTKPIRTLLSLDGGGVRGVAQIQFLEHLEEACQFPVRDIFDNISGCSIGAIICGGLVYNLDLSAKKASRDLFTHENCKSFMENHLFHRSVASTMPKYRGDHKREFIYQYLPDTPICQPPKSNFVCIPAFDVSRGKGVFFKSYDAEDGKRFVSIRQAVDCSSAAPGYFPSVKIDGAVPERDHPTAIMEYGVDGGLFANNPTDVAFCDSITLWKDAKIKIISIGTSIKPHAPYGNKQKLEKKSWFARNNGQKVVKKFAGQDTATWGGLDWLLQGNLVDTVMETTQSLTHFRMERLANALDHEYIRVNGPVSYRGPPDDTSKKNYDALRELGTNMWNDFKGDIMEMLKPRLEELRTGTEWKRILPSVSTKPQESFNDG